MDKYSNFSELAKFEKEGIDFELAIRLLDGAVVAIIAPHAGGIEPKTGPIAQEIAGNDFSFYCFCGRKPKGNSILHITSHRFDEPECIKLVAGHTWVVAIHGCNEKENRVFVGGLDKSLIADLVRELVKVGINVETSGHKYPGTDPGNICNRGKSMAGVQFELSPSFRNGNQIPVFVQAVRSVLHARQNSAIQPVNGKNT